MDIIATAIITVFATFVLFLVYLAIFSVLFVWEWPLMSMFNNYALPSRKDIDDTNEINRKQNEEEVAFIEKSDLNKSTIEYNGKTENTDHKDDVDYTQYGYYKNKK